MTIDSEQFLDIYAQALNTFDSKKIVSFCLPPTIVMNDKSKKVINNENELDQAFSRMLGKFHQAGIKKFVPKLQQTLRLSDTLFFSKMRWQFQDEHQQVSFSCAASYTLQQMPDKQLKIVVTVIDDDEDKLADIFSDAEEYYE